MTEKFPKLLKKSLILNLNAKNLDMQGVLTSSEKIVKIKVKSKQNFTIFFVFKKVRILAAMLRNKILSDDFQTVWMGQVFETGRKESIANVGCFSFAYINKSFQTMLLSPNFQCNLKSL